MTTTEAPAIPDLDGIPPATLGRLDGTALGNAIALCRERLEQDRTPPGAFNSGI